MTMSLIRSYNEAVVPRSMFAAGRAPEGQSISGRINAPARLRYGCAFGIWKAARSSASVIGFCKTAATLSWCNRKAE